MTDIVANDADRQESERREFLSEAIAGLADHPRRVPGKFLWDETGSILFDRICDDPDYYPTAHERALMPGALRDIAGLVGPGATIVEFGSGASRKIRALLDSLARPARYIAVDISRDYLHASVARLAPDYPHIAMTAVCADYSRPFRLPEAPGDGPVLGFFPGTTIGNFAPAEAEAFLKRIRDALGPSWLMIGADPNRDEARLLQAYGGCGGLMGAFHLNLLTRMSRELGAVFDREAFRHQARVLDDPFRVEAHLVAHRATKAQLGDQVIAFTAGEGFRTDVSHKYSVEAFRSLAVQAGWESAAQWIDRNGLFSMHLLRSDAGMR
ncbi:MAG: L-histidine N(alpha)-methyltransferase [Methylobacterium sp.]|uniref:L-histidine N(alpha)-methyltransferase n=1 Tax=Methylobacterium sp. TaxID=409 RepID=UPI0025FE1DDA|nr:L-histidine N(alpha)-methyltransferase [Methylobacterium sp.]MBX9930373.1 L-histidine N(alpha)-methyltransferase [Methylobacterium sp.]